MNDCDWLNNILWLWNSIFDMICDIGDYMEN